MLFRSVISVLSASLWTERGALIFALPDRLEDGLALKRTATHSEHVESVPVQAVCSVLRRHGFQCILWTLEICVSTTEVVVGASGVVENTQSAVPLVFETGN